MVMKNNVSGISIKKKKNTGEKKEVTFGRVQDLLVDITLNVSRF